jgi:hypothetical protein
MVGKGKSPYVRYRKEPYKYQYRSCSHKQANGRPNAIWQQTAHFAGDICRVCNIILHNNASSRRPHYEQF